MDNYSLEEYRILNETMRNQEDRCSQLIIFCSTSFGIIISFRNYIPIHYIPLVMLSVLWMCLISFRKIHYVNRFSAAFLIHKYDKKIEGPTFQKRKYDYEKALREEKSKKWSWPWLKKIFSIYSSDSFLILTFILIGCYFYFAGKFIIDCPKNKVLGLCLYLIISIIGLASIGYNIYLSNSQTLEYYLNELNKTPDNKTAL